MGAVIDFRPAGAVVADASATLHLLELERDLALLAETTVARRRPAFAAAVGEAQRQLGVARAELGRLQSAPGGSVPHPPA